MGEFHGYMAPFRCDNFDFGPKYAPICWLHERTERASVRSHTMAGAGDGRVASVSRILVGALVLSACSPSGTLEFQLSATHQMCGTQNVAGAEILLYDVEGELLTEAQTDADGRVSVSTEERVTLTTIVRSEGDGEPWLIDTWLDIPAQDYGRVWSLPLPTPARQCSCRSLKILVMGAPDPDDARVIGSGYNTTSRRSDGTVAEFEGDLCADSTEIVAYAVGPDGVGHAARGAVAADASEVTLTLQPGTTRKARFNRFPKGFSAAGLLPNGHAAFHGFSLDDALSQQMDTAVFPDVGFSHTIFDAWAEWHDESGSRIGRSFHVQLQQPDGEAVEMEMVQGGSGSTTVQAAERWYEWQVDTNIDPDGGQLVLRYSPGGARIFISSAIWTIRGLGDGRISWPALPDAIRDRIIIDPLQFREPSVFQHTSDWPSGLSDSLYVPGLDAAPHSRRRLQLFVRPI